MVLKLAKRKFGRLIVGERVDNDKYGHAMWECFCRCGRRKIIAASHLTSGRTKSCGCLRKGIK